VFPLPGKRFLGQRFCRYLLCCRSLEKDFVSIYSVPAPWKEISWREILCRYLRCSRSLEKDFCWYLRCSRSLGRDFLEREFVRIYDVPAPLRKILSVCRVRVHPCCAVQRAIVTTAPCEVKRHALPRICPNATAKRRSTPQHRQLIRQG